MVTMTLGRCNTGFFVKNYWDNSKDEINVRLKNNKRKNQARKVDRVKVGRKKFFSWKKHFYLSLEAEGLICSSIEWHVCSSSEKHMTERPGYSKGAGYYTPVLFMYVGTTCTILGLKKIHLMYSALLHMMLRPWCENNKFSLVPGLQL